MKKIIVGVMGPGPGATPEDIKRSMELGRLIAEAGWILLTGGMASGVMDSASRGAREAGGITVGVIPADDCSGMSEYVDIPIVTGMGSARNNINVLSSDAVIACGLGAGTSSEISLAIKAGKGVVLLGPSKERDEFFCKLSENVVLAGTPGEAVGLVRSFLRL